ncbi:DUF6785 family protein [Candidatus Poribacteria bacterium]
MADSVLKEAKIHLASGLTVRSLILSVVFVLLGNYWLKYTGLIAHSGNFAESVPPIPAVAGLILMVAFNPLLRRLIRKISLSAAEVIVTYNLVTIAVSMSSIGMVRYFLPVLTAPFYFATPENEYNIFNKHLPDWFVVSDSRALKESYEGSLDGSVPWGAWIVPLLVWTAFFIVLFWTMLCILVIFRRRWVEKERLTFPVVQFALEIAREDENKRSLVAPFFKNHIMWIGFSISFFYNLLNILNAIYPNVPAPGKSFNIGAIFTDRPLNAIRPMSFQYRPAIIGIGYLMPMGVNMSVWVFYFVLKFESVMASIMGYQIPGFPFVHNQSAGAFLALMIFLCWVARHEIKDVFAKAIGIKEVDDSQEPIPYRWAAFGSVFGIILICIWCRAAGMTVMTALVYFILIIGFALVYSRIRAQAGSPMIWLFPYGEHKTLMIDAVGPRAFIPDGSYANLTVFANLTFLSRGYFPAFMAYQLESFKHADLVGSSKRVMAFVIMLALVMGLAAGYYMHLTSFYDYGSNILEGGSGVMGGTRGAALIRQEYNKMQGYTVSNNSPDYTRTAAAGVGFLFTFALVLLRQAFLWFPLHPLGFAMVTAYGDPLWGPFLSVWIIKKLVMKYGGMRMYRKLVPGFLGLALGHFFTAGILWGALATTGKELFRAYGVWFG